MPTTRSLYTFKQFEQVFQAMAHEIAIEAVTNLKPRRITIKTFSSGQLSEVDDDKQHLRFFLRHLSFSRDSDDLHLDIEEKFYSTSAHCTKISFYSPEYKKVDGPKVKDEYGWEEFPVDHKKTDAEKKRRQKEINEFLEKLMKDAGMKIEPRFSLQNYSKH